MHNLRVNVDVDDDDVNNDDPSDGPGFTSVWTATQ